MSKNRTARRERARTRADLARNRSISTDGTGEFTGAFTLPTLSGSVVNEHTALTVSAVYQAVQIYSNTIAGLDLFLMQRHESGGHTPAFTHSNFDLVNSRPNRVMTSFKFRQSLVSHAVTHGNGFAEIQRKDGNPHRLHLMDPRNVKPEVHDDGTLWYHLTREHKDIPSRDVVHFAGLGFNGVQGYSPVTIARETLGLGMAQEKWQAALMGNSATPNGYLEIPGSLTETAENRIIDDFNRRHQGADRAGNVAILTGNMKWVQTSFSPADAELVLNRGFTVAEVARIFNLPQHMLGMLEHATFSNIEEQNRQFYQLSLMPWLKMIEQELDVKLLAAAERKVYFFRHDVKGLLRGDSAAQSAQDVSDFSHGFKSINEIRRARGDNPINDPAADKHFIPVNNMSALEDLMRPGPAKKPEPAPSAEPGDDTASLRSALVEPLREVLTDPIARMVRRECAAIRKAARRGGFADWIEEFGPSHAALVTEAITPAVWMLTAATGRDVNAPRVAAGMWEESREKLRGLVVCVPPDELPESVERLCIEWEATRAAAIVGRLIG